MALLFSIISSALGEALRWRGRELACASMLLVTASCVPVYAEQASDAGGIAPAKAAGTAAPATTTLAPPALPEPTEFENVAPTEASRINASIPFSADPNPSASPLALRGATLMDQARSLRCLAEAVYYEARSESEAGQRAVAQVVLNRVRSPAYPGSVCGVVYQGPLRAGGGCQFTFTCDGSLAWQPAGEMWLRARRIAAEALAGKVFAPVGLATHYHTHQVLPAWAWRLAKATVIGNHIFYRMQGAWGQPSAFRQPYSGREPSPATIIATRLPISLGRPSRAATSPLALTLSMPAASFGSLPATQPPPPPVNDRLPVSRVKPEFENSGRYLIGVPKPSAP
ncbi:MAG TPA: cell wall hydrolase [Allosphingosinicella sp.]|nr:cell wall hydrolase [Allosphingosinicella sp.]